MFATSATHWNQLTRTVIQLIKCIVNFDFIRNQLDLLVSLSKFRCAVPKLLSFQPRSQREFLRDGDMAALQLGILNEYINFFTMTN